MIVMAKAPDRWHRWLMDLRSGGRISVFEPINVLMRDQPAGDRRVHRARQAAG
jgi:hypothetical protein